MSGAWHRTWPETSGVLRVVRAPLLAEHGADLAERTASAQGLAHRREQVRLAARDPPHLGERCHRRLGVPLGADPGGALELAALDRRVEPVDVDPLRLVLLEPVDADDYSFAVLDLPGIAVRALLDLAL